MAIIVAEENVIPLSDVPKHVPVRRGGKKLNKATPFRWAKPGVRGVRLETIRIGGTICTSVEALQRFFERLSEGDTAPTPGSDRQTSAPPLATRTARNRAHAVATADAELTKLGI